MSPFASLQQSYFIQYSFDCYEALHSFRVPPLISSQESLHNFSAVSVILCAFRIFSRSGIDLSFPSPTLPIRKIISSSSSLSPIYHSTDSSSISSVGTRDNMSAVVFFLPGKYRSLSLYSWIASTQRPITPFGLFLPKIEINGR